MWREMIDEVGWNMMVGLGAILIIFFMFLAFLTILVVTGAR